MQSILSKSVFFFFLSIGLFSLSAQNLDDVLKKVVPPPPEAAALGKYGDIPVGTYTGIPSVSIPIYEIQGRSLNLPISLSYHASGVKVEEMASWVGIGWSLNAGGAITRTVNDNSDFGEHGIVNDRQIPRNIVPDCSIEWEDGTTDVSGPNNAGFMEGLVFGHISTGSVDRDSEPDRFFFNFGGYSGKFFFDENNNIIHDQTSELKFTHSPTKDSDYWEVITPDGTKYTFGGGAWGETGDTWNEWMASQGANTPVPHVSSWYLKSITSTIGETINFKYRKYDYQTLSFGPETQYGEVIGKESMYIYYDNGKFFYDTYYGCQKDNVSTRGTNISNVDGLFIDEIRLEKPNGEAIIAKFTPLFDRIDLTNESYGSRMRLKTIEIYIEHPDASKTTIKEFALDHHRLENKLWLKEVKEIGTINNSRDSSKPAHTFEYYNHELFPNSNSKAMDYWGFYNGEDNDQRLAPAIAFDYMGVPYMNPNTTAGNRMPDADFAKYGILTKINYPTGGSTELEYESNSFSNFRFQIAACNGVASADCTLPQTETFTVTKATDVEFTTAINSSISLELLGEVCDGGRGGLCNWSEVSTETEFYWTSPGTEIELDYYIYPHNGDPDIVVEYRAQTTDNWAVLNTYSYETESEGKEIMQLDDVGFYRVKLTGQIGNNDFAKGTVKIYKRIETKPFKPRLIYPDNNTHVFNNEGKTTLSLQPGQYSIEVYEASTPLPDTKAYIFVDYDVDPTEFGELNYNHDIVANNTFGAGLRIKKLITTSGNGQPIVKSYDYTYEDGRSSGVLMHFPVNFRVAISPSSLDPIPEMCLNPSFYSSSHYPLGISASGNFVGYNHVTINHGENGEGGKSVITYFNKKDNLQHPDSYKLLIQEDILGSLEYMPGFKKHWIYFPNIPLQTNYYRNGNVLNQREYKANGTLIKEIANQYESFTTSTHGFKILGTWTPPPTGLFSMYPHEPCYGMMYQNYNMTLGWSRMKSSTETLYDDYGNALSNTTDYFYDNKFRLLRKENTDSKERKVYTTYEYPDQTSNSSIAREMASRHIIAPTLKESVSIKPISEGSSDKLISSRTTNYDKFGNNYLPKEILIYENFPPNNAKRAEFKYNDKGNLIEQNKVGDNPQSFIWAHGASMPIASVTNASSSNIAFSGFETDEYTSSSNWQYDASQILEPSEAKTGKKVFQFSNNTQGIVKSDLDTKENYIVSFWAKGAGDIITVNEIVQELTADWTYYEFQMTNSSQIQLLAQNSNPNIMLDELRLYPAGAQMTTYAYQELVGMVSSCDANNVITYYEYDGFGRLLNIKDAQGNVLKKYEYQYHQN